MIIAVAYQTEESNHCNVRICVVQYFLGVVADEDSSLYTKFGIVAYIHSYNLRIDINSTYNLRPFLVEVTKNVFAHFSASVLYYFNLTHNEKPPSQETKLIDSYSI